MEYFSLFYLQKKKKRKKDFHKEQRKNQMRISLSWRAHKQTPTKAKENLVHLQLIPLTVSFYLDFVSEFLAIFFQI